MSSKSIASGSSDATAISNNVGGASRHSSRPDPKINKRMTAVLKVPGNQVCADCPTKRPLWASFLVSPLEPDKLFGVFCCASCAQHHFSELGDKRCAVKYLKFSHEWTLADVEVMEDTGNDFVNAIFEATLTPKDFEKATVLEDEAEETDRRAKFVKKKYKKKKFFDEIVYHQQVLMVLQRKRQKRLQKKEKADKKESESSSLRDGLKKSCSSRIPRPSTSSSRKRNQSLDNGNSSSLAGLGHHSSSEKSMESSSSHTKRTTSSQSDGESKHSKMSSSKNDSRHSKKGHSRNKPQRSSSSTSCSSQSKRKPRSTLQRSSSSRSSSKRDRISLERTDSLSKRSGHSTHDKHFKTVQLNSTPHKVVAVGQQGLPTKEELGYKDISLQETAPVPTAIHVSIESKFLATLGIGTTLSSFPVAVHPFLSEAEDDLPKRQGPRTTRSCFSDDEGVSAKPLRKRLSNKNLLGEATDGEGALQAKQSRPRRASNPNLLSKAFASDDSDTEGSARPPQRVRRNLSRNNLQAPRRRASNPNLCGRLNTPQSEKDEPRLPGKMRRRLSNTNLVASDSNGPFEETKASGGPIRRCLSQKNLRAVPDACFDRYERESAAPLSSKRLVATSSESDGETKTPRMCRRLSNKNRLAANAAGDAPASRPRRQRRRASNSNLLHNGNTSFTSADESEGESKPNRLNRCNSKNSLNITAANEDPNHRPIARRRSNPNILSMAAHNSSVSNHQLAMVSDKERVSGQQNSPRLMRRHSTNNLLNLSYNIPRSVTGTVPTPQNLGYGDASPDDSSVVLTTISINVASAGTKKAETLLERREKRKLERSLSGSKLAAQETNPSLKTRLDARSVCSGPELAFNNAGGLTRKQRALRRRSLGGMSALTRASPIVVE